MRNVKLAAPLVALALVAAACGGDDDDSAETPPTQLVGKLPPETWDLILSVEFIAIILIGGAGTTSGALLGAFFVVLLPKFVETVAHWMGDQAAGDSAASQVWDVLVSTAPGDGGLISTGQVAPGYPLPIAAIPPILYGLLIVAFLLFEPLGLYGVWVKFRNYWKRWPFSY